MSKPDQYDGSLVRSAHQEAFILVKKNNFFVAFPRKKK
jgi:hypothetical protein